MKTIPLTQGAVAIVDDSDYESVAAFNWSLRNIGRKKYAGRYRRQFEGYPEGTFVLLHQFLLPRANRIDHRDGDGLNNRRRNLRPATSQQNNRGFRLKDTAASSRYRGVSWDSCRGKWKAQAKTEEGKTLFLGRFNSEPDAALAYDRYVLENYGDFACPNFV